MALSFCSNWEAAVSPLFNAHSDEVADALLGFLDPVNSPLLSLDPIFSTIQYDESNLFYPSPSPPSAVATTDTNSLLLPSISEPSMLSLPPPPYDNCFMYHCPKRHRSCSDFDCTPPPLPHFDTGPFVLPFEASLPPVKTAAVAGSGSLSSQSMAARERRRRISEKMRELSLLIPGGSRMNTAEMLQAAHSYVRFLQVQVGMLSLIGSSQVSRDAESCNNLKLLVASPVIQERLSSAGRCMLTEEVVDELAADIEIRSSPLISKDLDRFVSSIREMTKGNK